MARRNRQTEYERQQKQWQESNKAAYLALERRKALEANDDKLRDAEAKLSDLEFRLKHMRRVQNRLYATCTAQNMTPEETEQRMSEFAEKLAKVEEQRNAAKRQVRSLNNEKSAIKYSTKWQEDAMSRYDQGSNYIRANSEDEAKRKAAEQDALEGGEPGSVEGEQQADAQRARQEGQQAGQEARKEEGEEEEDGLGETLGHALGTYFGSKLGNRTAINGLDPSGISASNRSIADTQERGAGKYQSAAQASMQIANRNYRDEAEKNAAAQGAIKNAQKVANLGNASAGAAALARGVETADYDRMMQRSDQQRTQGVQYQDYENRMRQQAEGSRAAAKQRDFTAAQVAQRNAQSDYAASGPPKEGEDGEKGKGQPNTGGYRIQGGTKPPVTEQQNYLPPEVIYQNVMNYLSGSEKREDAQGRDRRGDAAFVREVDEKARQLLRWYAINVAKDESVYAILNTPLPINQRGPDDAAWEDEYIAMNGGQHREIKEAFITWLAGKQNRGHQEVLTSANRPNKTQLDQSADTTDTGE